MTQDVAAARVDLERLAKLVEAVHSGWSASRVIYASEARAIKALLARVAALEEGIDGFCMDFIMLHDESADGSDLRSEKMREAVADLARIKSDSQKGGGANADPT